MPGVTKEQIQAAREADLFAWLQSHEPGVLKRDGPNYRHKEHDSLVYVTGKRYWYWNSRGRSINALDYLIQIRGYGLVDAVQALAGGEIGRRRLTKARRQSPGTERAGKETVYAALGQTVCYRRCFVFAAARDQFGCDQPVLSERAFYEARYHGEPVCVFVGKGQRGESEVCLYARYHRQSQKGCLWQ